MLNIQWWCFLHISCRVVDKVSFEKRKMVLVTRLLSLCFLLSIISWKAPKNFSSKKEKKGSKSAKSNVRQLWKVEDLPTIIGKMHTTREKVTLLFLSNAFCKGHHSVWKPQKKSHLTFYVYILSGQKLIKNAKNGPFRWLFQNLKLVVKQCYQAVFIWQKLMENAKCDIFGNFQTLCL